MAIFSPEHGATGKLNINSVSDSVDRATGAGGPPFRTVLAKGGVLPSVKSFFAWSVILLTMIRLSVLYPAAPGSRFNWDYYLGPHLALSQKLLTPRGLVRTEIDRGIGSLPPGAPAPYHAVGHLFFRSLADLQSALAATAADFIADERNYTDVPSVVQISEVVE